MTLRKNAAVILLYFALLVPVALWAKARPDQPDHFVDHNKMAQPEHAQSPAPAKTTFRPRPAAQPMPEPVKFGNALVFVGEVGARQPYRATVTAPEDKLCYVADLEDGRKAVPIKAGLVWWDTH